MWKIFRINFNKNVKILFINIIYDNTYYYLLFTKIYFRKMKNNF